MKLYFAGSGCWKYIEETVGLESIIPSINVLQSFKHLGTLGKKVMRLAKSSMLDSGAFTFLRNDKHPNLDNYITRYIEYINAADIKLFFELDIDKIIGYDRVIEICRRLERETGKRPIPVWHKHLGKTEFLRMCDEYDYVAIGGFAIRVFNPSEFKYLPWFINEAHKRGTKVHGLGFSKVSLLHLYRFDSIDSSGWTVGGRFGWKHIFTKNGFKQVMIPATTVARIDYHKLHLYNFFEWLKLARYVESYL